jgi:ribosome biogenesis GTPase A
MSAQESICDTPEFRLAMERAETLLKSLEDCGRTQEIKRLNEVIDTARQMRFSIGVVGQAKRGKSTLINGLLGRQDDMLAPVNRYPATNVVSCFANGHKEEAKVLFAPDGKLSKSISPSDIKYFACEEFNPGNQKGVKVIEVIGSFPGLGKDVVLVDTPGTDNALSNLHDTVLMDFLPPLPARPAARCPFRTRRAQT